MTKHEKNIFLSEFFPFLIFVFPLFLYIPFLMRKKEKRWKKHEKGKKLSHKRLFFPFFCLFSFPFFLFFCFFCLSYIFLLSLFFFVLFSRENNRKRGKKVKRQRGKKEENILCKYCKLSTMHTGSALKVLRVAVSVWFPDINWLIT